VNALAAGAPWREAGVKDSKGCGSCMRVAPIGYFYQHDEDQLQTVARSQSWLTHRHPAADAACIGAARLVKLALDGASPAEFPSRVLAVTEGLSEEFDAALLRIGHVLSWTDEESALAHIGPTRGGGWIAEEAVAMALYCVLKHPDDYRAAVILGANINGDSDTVASIAGGILGARLGPEAIPADWAARLENAEYYLGLADRLAAAKSALRAG
jgi:ADP-ribosylglycohydrolase